MLEEDPATGNQLCPALLIGNAAVAGPAAHEGLRDVCCVSPLEHLREEGIVLGRRVGRRIAAGMVISLPAEDCCGVGDGAVDPHALANRSRIDWLLQPVEEGAVGRDEVHPGTHQDDIGMPGEEVPLRGEALRMAGITAIETRDEREFRGRVRDPGAQRHGDPAVLLQLDQPDRRVCDRWGNEVPRRAPLRSVVDDDDQVGPPHSHARQRLDKVITRLVVGDHQADSVRHPQTPRTLSMPSSPRTPTGGTARRLRHAARAFEYSMIRASVSRCGE